MKIFRFEQETGMAIEAFGSVNFVLSRIVRLDGGAYIGCIHLGKGGVIGYHQTKSHQLLLVVQGSGWVRGEHENRVAVTEGHAVFWETGEWHETGTEVGLTAIVIESETIEPGLLLKEVEGA